MTPAARLAALAALIAPWLGGCTVLDTRKLDVSIFDASQSHRQVVVSIAATGFDQVRFEIDGAPAGTFRAWGFATVDTSRLVQGEHVLTARAVAGRPVDEASLRFQVVVPPPKVVRVDPPFGPVPGDAPLTILVEFSEPVTIDDAVEPLHLGWTGTGAISVERTVASDGRSVRFHVSLPGRADDFALDGAVRNARGATLRIKSTSTSSWKVRRFEGGFSGPLSNLLRPGPAVLHPYSGLGPGEPPSAEILLDGVVVAQVGPPPWDPVDWDTSALPDGRYVWSIRAPGYAESHYGNWAQYTIDGTPPAATCYSEKARPGELYAEECVYIIFSEQLDARGGTIELRDDGVSILASTFFQGGLNSVNVCPLAPRRPGVSEEVIVNGFADLAGNPAPSLACTRFIPPWIAPYGTGPLSSAGVEFRASGIGLSGSYHGSRAKALGTFTLAWTVAAGTPGAGSLLVAGSWWDDQVMRPESAGTPDLGPSRPSVSDDWMVFASRPSPSSANVLAVSYRLRNSWSGSPAVSLDTVATVDADEPIVRGNPIVAVWTEGTPGGGRSLHGAAALVGYEVWEPLPGDARGSPEASVSSPALYVHHATSSQDVALVAFLETTSVGAPRLRAASLHVLGGAWVPLVDDLDLGLGTPSDPGIAMAGEVPVLAWIEDGQVRARTGTLDAAGLGFGPALALNHDPARPARAVRLIATAGSRATLLFIEAGPAGDELWARWWDGSGWVLQPGPINAGTGDAIVELAADGTPSTSGVVAWTDAQGRVFLRGLNW